MAEREPQTDRAPGSLSADISRLVVRLVADYTGRGPTRARTTIRDDTIICVTQDNMTKAERRLAAEGETDLVVTIRRKFQSTMREDLVGGVELLTGRKVLSFMSDHDADNDYAAEVFILDGPPIVETAGESGADAPDADGSV
jgi:uncharacterized protein YbcI